jgi:hypothetical protein
MGHAAVAENGALRVPVSRRRVLKFRLGDDSGSRQRRAESDVHDYFGAHYDERPAWRNAADRWRPFWSIRPSIGWRQQKTEATCQACMRARRTTGVPW